MGEHRIGQVRAADRLAGLLAGAQRRVVELESLRARSSRKSRRVAMRSSSATSSS
jgi:hypothetical protein